MNRKCRFCADSLTETFADLGMQPLSNAFLVSERLAKMEPYYPLHAYVCGACFLVQLEEFESPEAIFTDYAYFSSFSTSWLAHAEWYATQMRAKLNLTGDSRVVEIASNDGYLLQYFLQAGIPVLGVEPAANCAAEAERRGIPTLVRFFGADTARQMVADGIRADLLVGNNVLAHVPDLNDFVAGIDLLLTDDGTATLEFPHLLQLMKHTQYDTIYHEHFSYFSLITVQRVFEAHGLIISDVEELPTHGGSLRIFARHRAAGDAHPRVSDLLQREKTFGLDRIETYERFAESVIASKLSLWAFLTQAKRNGRRVAAYGAAAKGNTLLNYCGVRDDLIEYIVDKNPYKQGRFAPGSHLPVYPVERVRETKPDFLLVLPWNLAAEVTEQMAEIAAWGGKFVVAIPETHVLD